MRLRRNLQSCEMVRVREIARGASKSARLEAPPGPALDGSERSGSGTQPLTIKFERNRWRWSQMASVFGRSISHAVPGRRISTPFTEIGRDEGVNRGMSF